MSSPSPREDEPSTEPSSLGPVPTMTSLGGAGLVAPNPTRVQHVSKADTGQKEERCSARRCNRLVEALDDYEEDRGAAEVRSIMQRGKVRESPPTTFLGVSPPVRSAGAANPLVQDWNWRSNAYKSSHSNLQALREIDARGVSFLRMSGDSALLIESPEAAGVLGASDCSATTYFSGSRDSCQVSSHRVQAKPMMCQVGFNVA